ncbi:MAG: hypothetical protein H6600_06740 [Flavobacteriales bacterium]|nr:hypothetical protein [Flavobacteriales bacterium]
MTKAEHLQAALIWMIFALIALTASLYFFIYSEPVNFNEDIENVTGTIANEPKLESAGGKTLSQKIDIELKEDSRTFQIEGYVLEAVEPHIHQLKKGHIVTIACFKKGHEDLVESSHKNHHTSVWGLYIGDELIADEKELLNPNGGRYAGYVLLLGVLVCGWISVISYRTYSRTPNKL